MKKIIPLQQIQEWKKRAGDPEERSSFLMEIHHLRSRRSPDRGYDDFVPIKLVTTLEVFARTWIGRLIDHGSPFLERAEQLAKRTDFKLDFQSYRAIHGKTVTIGDLIGHSLSINKMKDFEEYFDALLDTKEQKTTFQDMILARIDRRVLNNPFFYESRKVFPCLGRLFWVRHVLCHELPSEPPYNYGELEEFLAAAEQVIEAAENIFLDIVYGTNRHQSRLEVLKDAQERATKLLADVAAAFERRRTEITNPAQLALLEEDQKAWAHYLETHCKYSSFDTRPDDELIVAIVQKIECEKRLRFLGPATSEDGKDDGDREDT